MANANVTPTARRTRRSYATAFLVTTATAVPTDPDEALPSLLSLLTNQTDDQIAVLLDGMGAPLLERQLLLTMHRFIRHPKKDPATLALVDRWFSAMPELLRLVKPGTHTHALIQWTDSAAEAYLLN